jgi:hypothetical protein
MHVNQPNSVKLKMRPYIKKWCKLVRGIKAQRHKLTGVKEGLDVFTYFKQVWLNFEVFTPVRKF